MLPETAKGPLREHLARVRQIHERDLAAGYSRVSLPYALARKYPNAATDWGWQWVFPATRFYRDHETGQRRRHHLHETVVQRAVKEAIRRAGVAKPASPHTFRHYSGFRTMPGRATVVPSMACFRVARPA